ncbi:MAG: porin [Betaproteobacteria bacterium]|nr:porin [Betaproteobacteria bacterium]
MPQNFQGSITGIALPNGARSSNAIGYSTPSEIGSLTEGFQGRFMYGLGENASNAGATANDGDYLGAAFHMQRGPIDVGVAFAKYWLAAMGDIRETVIVGTLRLGDGKLYAQYLQDDTGSANSMRGHLLGGSYVAGAVEWKAT